MLDNGFLDENRSDWICDDILVIPVDSIHGPYNPFPLNPWVTPWMSLLNDDMVIPWMIWEGMTSGDDKIWQCWTHSLTVDGGILEIWDERILDENKSGSCNLFRLNPWLILWISPLSDEMRQDWRTLVDGVPWMILWMPVVVCDSPAAYRIFPPVYQDVGSVYPDF